MPNARTLERTFARLISNQSRQERVVNKAGDTLDAIADVERAIAVEKNLLDKARTSQTHYRQLKAASKSTPTLDTMYRILVKRFMLKA
jgi:phage-related minor tail protein